MSPRQIDREKRRIFLTLLTRWSNPKSTNRSDSVQVLACHPHRRRQSMKSHSRFIVFLTAAWLAGATGARADTTISSPLTSANATSTQTLSSGTLTVSATGSVADTDTTTSKSNAITIKGTSTLDNFGTIADTGTGRAIRENTGTAGENVAIHNFSGGLISSAGQDGIQFNTATAAVSLVNDGTISSSGGQAIDWNAVTFAANALTNSATGIITASGDDALRPGVNGTVTNSGIIKSIAINGSSSDGIDAQTNTGIAIANSTGGQIEGGRHGITGGNTNAAVNNGAYTMSVTNQASATIQGDNGSGLNIDGINGNEVVTIVNHGTITGNGHDLGDGVAHDGDGVDVDGLVNLVNTGTIKSINAFGGGGLEHSEGVTVGGGTINNSGTIEGDVASGNATAIGRGITIAGVDKDANGNAIPIQAMYAATSITNSGLIKGQSDSAIAFPSTLSSGFAVSIMNTATGTLEGGGATAAALQLGADNATIVNAGTIIADASGKAIDLGSGNSSLVIQGGSIVGDISGGTGTSTLSFNLGSGGTFSYKGAISQFAGVQVNSGTFVLNGSLAAAGAVTVNAGGALAGLGTVSGSLTLNSGGTLSPGTGANPGTLTLGGNLALNGGSALNFALSAGGHGQLALAGSGLTLAGPSSGLVTITLVDPDGTAAFGTYALIVLFGGTPGTLTNWNLNDFTLVAPPEWAGSSLSIGNNGVDLNVAVVPEPATYAAIFGALALGGAGWWRRRAQRPA